MCYMGGCAHRCARAPENTQKQLDSMPPELMKIVEAWPRLPEHNKAANIGRPAGV
jgi:hypothetical protein